MRIGHLAVVTSVSIDTLRYYERLGLLPRAARTPGGYREFPEGAVNRIRVIRNAVTLGFPLREIARVLSIRDRGGAPCRQVRDYAEGLVAQLDRRIAEMRGEKRAMMAMIREWDRRLAATREGAPARLLEQEIVPRPPRPRTDRLRRRR